MFNSPLWQSVLSESRVKKWLADVFKIGCGAALGYAMLLGITLFFWDFTFPLIQATAVWWFGTEI